MATEDPQIERSVDRLARVRDELRVQMHLARQDAKDQWRQLEGKWQRLQQNLTRAERAGSESAREIQVASRLLVDELERGYERIRDALAARGT